MIDYNQFSSGNFEELVVGGRHKVIHRCEEDSPSIASYGSGGGERSHGRCNRLLGFQRTQTLSITIDSRHAGNFEKGWQDLCQLRL